MTAEIHSTAIVEEGVEIGSGTAVWDHAHLRGPCRIGDDCIIGEKTYVAYGVEVGDRVKINAFVYVCTGVTIERGAMISARVVFTNDRFPRATTPDLESSLSSEPTERTLSTAVREGATVGAGAVIGPGLEIGRFSMVGMGAVVTRSVPDFALVLGNPARVAGAVCRCGRPLTRSFEETEPVESERTCRDCGRRYRLRGDLVSELCPAG